MTRSGSRTRALAAIVLLVVLGACESSDTSEDHTRFDPVTPFATVVTTTTVAARTPEPQWSSRSFTLNADGAQRSCVELSTAAIVATTCLGLPGVLSWTVADAHFVLALGDIALTNGSVIRADAAGVAVGFLPPDAVPASDGTTDCDRSALAPAVAEHYPEATVAWLPSRCAGFVASVAALLQDRSEVVALIEKTDGGRWQVFATFRAPVRCKLLDTMSRNKCKLLRYDD